MDQDTVRQALVLDARWIADLRRAWLALTELAVFGDVQGTQLGAAGKMRQRVLEAGERLRSLAAPRDWIPRPREQLKNALASALHLEQSLTELERAVRDLDGADAAALGAALSRLKAQLERQLPAMKNRWAKLLDAQ